MKKLIQLIDNKMAEYFSSIKSIKNGIKDIQCSKGSFELVKIDPDSANYDVIAEATDIEYKEDVEYIAKFKGWMDDYQNEEQVKIALEKLYRLINSIETKLDKRINCLKEELDGSEKAYFEYKTLKSKLNNYSKNTYIEENEFNIICSFLGKLNEEETIDILHKIGKNNAFIELERKGEIELLESLKGEVDLNTLEEMSKVRNNEESIEDEYSYSTISRKIKEALLKLEEINIDYNLKKYIEETFDIFYTFEDKISRETIEEADLFKDDLESIDQYLLYSLAITLLLIDSINEKNISKINDIYNTHINSIYYKKVTKEEKLLIDDYKNLLIDIVNEYYDDETYNKFIHSYSSISDEEISNYVDNETLQSIKIMKIINRNKDKISTMELEDLTIFLKELNKEIDIYKDMLSKDDSEDNDTELDGLDFSNVLNYVIVRDTDAIMNNIDSILTEHPDVNPSLFSRALNKLFMINSSVLYTRKTCKSILSTYNTPNPYDIREERAGSIRICFRSFMSMDKHVFYEVISFAYGSCGDMKKSENLKQSIKEYSDYKAEYDSIEKEFKDKNNAFMSKYITEGLTLYNEFLSLDNEKKKGFVLND